MGKYKDKKGTSKAGDFIRSLVKGETLNKVLGVGFSLATGNIKGAISKLTNSGDLTVEQIDRAEKLLELDYKDLADARDLQKVALSQSDLFSKRFIYYLSIAIFLFSSAIVVMLFFVEIPDKNRDVINFILGVVIGTGLTGVFNFFYGSSKGSKDKTDMFKKNF